MLGVQLNENIVIPSCMGHRSNELKKSLDSLSSSVCLVALPTLEPKGQPPFTSPNVIKEMISLFPDSSELEELRKIPESIERVITQSSLVSFEGKSPVNKKAKIEEPSFDSRTLFEELKKRSSSLDIEMFNYNKLSCRFPDILCPKQTAVKIGDDKHPYFHANNINLKGLRFIAAQFPYLFGLELFWKCSLEKANVIIDLTNSDDYTKDKNLSPYTPGPKKYCTTGNKTLSMESSKIAYTEEITYNDLPMIALYKYKITEENQEREVSRIHFEGWIDRDGLNVERLHKLIEYIQPYIQQENACPLIHCRAGIGRTCTLIAAIYLKSLINQGVIQDRSQLFEALKDAILLIRQQRGPYSVQTVEQIQTLWDLSCRYLSERPS